MRVSIVVPLHNEEESLPLLFPRLADALKSADCSDFEFICVDDGSTDRTVEVLEDLRNSFPQIKGVVFSRNFGLDVAISAGLSYASGDVVIPIDADLQDPPELIPLMIDLWRQGFQVVIAVRTSRAGETRAKKATAAFFYWLFNRISDIKIPYNSGNFRLLDRKVVEVIKSMPERTRFLRALSVWAGFRQVTLPFQRDPRMEGMSKFRMGRMIRYALDALTSFSAFPARMVGVVGFVISSASFLYAVFLVIFKLAGKKGMVPGYTSLMVVMLFLGGIQLLVLGVLGEYLGRIYNEVKERPLYIVQENFGF